MLFTQQFNRDDLTSDSPKNRAYFFSEDVRACFDDEQKHNVDAKSATTKCMGPSPFVPWTSLKFLRLPSYDATGKKNSPSPDPKKADKVGYTGATNFTVTVSEVGTTPALLNFLADLFGAEAGTIGKGLAAAVSTQAGLTPSTGGN